MSEIYVCKSTFLFELDGVEVHVRRGSTVRAGHSIMVGREDMFTPLVVDYEVEAKPKAPLKTPAPPSARKQGSSGGTR